ncbi:hypothetical protein TNCV_503061 [Trichonephila clavipes]|nr:hypothetical protein TNCV_503061 [Trichonephila clavipes]
MCSAFTEWGTLNSHRAASSLVRLVEGKRSGRPLTSQGVSPENRGGKRDKSYCLLYGHQSYGRPLTTLRSNLHESSSINIPPQRISIELDGVANAPLQKNSDKNLNISGVNGFLDPLLIYLL